MRRYLLEYLLLLLVPFLALSEVTQRSQKNLTSNQIIQFGAEQLLPFDTNTTAIVTCVDGTLKAIDMERGMVLWSYATGPPLYTSSHYPIIPSIDGELYLYTNDGVKKHIWNLRELVQKSPFHVPGLSGERDNSAGDSEDKGGIIYLGQKESQLFALEPRTGLMWKCGDDQYGCATRARDHSQSRDQHLTYIARVNYKVHAVDLQSGEAKWNVSYAEFRSWSDQSSEHVTDDVAPVTLVSSVDGTLLKLDDVTGAVTWRIELNSPVIHVHQSEISPKYRLLVKEQRALTQLLSRDPQDSTQSRVFIAQSDGYLFVLEPLALPNLDNDGAVVTSPWPRVEGGDTDGALVVISDLTPVNQCPKIDGKCVTGIHSLNTNLDADPFSHVIGNATHYNTSRDPPGPYRPPTNQLPDRNHVSDQQNSTPWLIFGAISALALIGGATMWHVRTLFRTKPVTAVKAKPSPAKPKTKAKSGKNKTKSTGDVTKKGNSDITRPPQSQTSQSRATKHVDGTMEIGGLKITTTILGYGSSGTIVYLGYFNGRKVAVKRLLIDFLADQNSDRSLREVEMLIKSDEHPHVIRYYHHELDGAFLYLALQYCPLSLQQLMAFIHEQEPLEENLPEEIVSWIPNIDKRQLLYQLTLGVHYLHSRGIVHRDLKPQNVLIDERRHVKISDMGLAKHVTGTTSHGSVIARHKSKKGSAEESEGPVGTIGWTAPEVISQAGDSSSPVPAQSLDVWSLGCLLSWVWTGHHPFGPRSDREWRIVRGQRTPLNDALAEDLVAQMTHSDPQQRPDILSVLRHPFWWSASKTLRFLAETSDHVEALPSTHPLVVALHDGQSSAFGSVNDWSQVIDQGLIHDSGRYRRYNTVLLRDLLRLIRNKAHHYRDLDAELQRKLGALPDGFLGYFLWRFPNLVMYLYQFTQQHCSTDPVLKAYFDFDPLQHHNTPL